MNPKPASGGLSHEARGRLCARSLGDGLPMKLWHDFAAAAFASVIDPALTDPDVADLRQYLKDHPKPVAVELSHVFGVLQSLGADIPSIPGAACELLERAGWFKEAIAQTEAAGMPEEALKIAVLRFDNYVPLDHLRGVMSDAERAANERQFAREIAGIIKRHGLNERSPLVADALEKISWSAAG